MKKRSNLLVELLLCLAAVPVSAYPVNDRVEFKSAVQNPDGLKKAKVLKLPVLPAPKHLRLSDSPILKNVLSESMFRSEGYKAKFRLPENETELSGVHVLTYNSLLTDVASGGGECIISPTEYADTIVIENFWDIGINLRAGIDYNSGKISIPNQKVSTTPTYGDIDFAFSKPDGKPDRSAFVEGVISENGVISIDDWWGVYVIGGEYKDSFFGIYGNTVIERSNGEMGSTMFDGSSEKYGVVVKQISSNVVSVKNFANRGKTVEISLLNDGTGLIESQMAIEDKTNGDWYTFSAEYSTDGSLLSYGETINLNKSDEKRKLSWGNWTMINAGSSQMFFWDAITSGYVTTDFDIEYPSLSVDEFEGEGTEDSPYLIKKIDDLVLLSNKVNEVTDYPYSNGAANYARVFLGKYFRLENDIDMTGYRFTPIGNKWQNVFAGSFDGNGRKLTGLNIVTNESGYAALFGICDTLSVIKNLTVENANVETTGFYCSAIAGWSRGTIDNCKVVNSKMVNNGGLTAAPIAGIGTIILNCQTDNNEVIGLGGYAAGIAGEVDSRVENCSVTNTRIFAGAAVEGYPSGGIVGLLYHKATADKCYFSGTINATVENSSIGGLFGSVYMGSVTNSFNTGTVTGFGPKSYVGGIVGHLSGTLRNCYNVGRISSSSSRNVGGLTGSVTFNKEEGVEYHSNIESCYSIGQIVSETFQYDPETEVRELLGTVEEGAKPVFSNIYFDRQMIDLNSKNYGVKTSELVSKTGPKGFSSEIWDFKEGYYPQLKVFSDTECSMFSVSSILFDEGSSTDKVAKNALLNSLGNTEFNLYKTINGQGTISKEGYYCSIVDNTLQLSDSFGVDTLYISNGTFARYYILKISPIEFEGDGTKENPYKISTKEDLISLSRITTKYGQFFPDTYFLMTNDIDMEYSEEFLGICSDHNDPMNQFDGHFDGGGFTIHRLLINAMEWTVRPEDAEDGVGTPNTTECLMYKGFFGRISPKGSLSNLNIASDCKFEFWASSGAFAGYNYGVIDNCRNYADVTGYSKWIGGIAGQNPKGGRIINCYNEGSIISGYGNSGGIAGTTAGTIENCMNAGYVSVESVSTFCAPNSNKLNFAGGICGSSNGSVIKNVLNAGTVYAGYSKAGGITGSFDKSSSGDGANDMINAINYGQVFSWDQVNVGAIAGTNGSEGEIKDVYYDGQTTVYKAAVNTDYRSMTSLETKEIVKGLDAFSDELWLFEENMYPVLKQFKDEAAANKARRIFLPVPSGVSVKDLSADITLADIEGVTWTLYQGNNFVIENGKLKSPLSVNEIVMDTLKLSWGEFEKLFVLRRLPNMPLEGHGTEESPYLITSADDWVNLSAYMNLTSESFEGKYLKITENISFEGKDFVPMANNGKTFFEGCLDGNGKKISDITYSPINTYEGLFGIIGVNGSVSNLTVSGTINSEKANTAGFCGKLYGKLNNCINEMDITSTAASVAGICATVYSGASLENCINKGTVTGKNSNIAGIAANVEHSVTFIKCVNTGKIVNEGTGSYTAGLVASSKPSIYSECYNTGIIEIINKTSASNVAGLIAYANASPDNDTYQIERCYNTADISAKAVVAGLVAAGNNYGRYKLLFTDCYNEGDITSASDKAVTSSPTAGISCWHTPGSVFSNCSNSGTIISNNNVYTGGISGFYLGSGTETDMYKFIGCTNTGNIKALGNQGGGIVAYVSNYTSITDCVNKGNVEGGFGLGGIVGCFIGVQSVMSNCYNTGDVTTSSNRAGGLLGYNSTKGNVVECFNLGNVSSTSELQGIETTSGYGIGGLAGQGGSMFVNCYNMGTVKGASRVGGLIGFPVKGNTQLESCYNAGEIVAPVDTCANLIGVNLENAGMWNENNTVSNTYYVTDFGEFKIGSKSLGTGLTIAELAMLDMGDKYVSSDNYSLPVLVNFEDNEYAKVYSAAVVVLGDDTYKSVTGNFKVGTPADVVWTSSVSNIVFKENDAVFSDDEFIGEAILTATCGDVQKTLKIYCEKEETSGIEQELTDNKIIEEKFYTLSGVEVEKSVVDSDIESVYIVVRIYENGFVETVKYVKR